MANYGVPGAYLHEDITKDKRILMNTRRVFVDIMCQVNPEYEHKVNYENGGKVLYLLVLRAIYVCIQSAMMWYNLLYTAL